MDGKGKRNSSGLHHPGRGIGKKAEIIIDDKAERWTIGADHSWMTIKLNMGAERVESPGTTTTWKTGKKDQWQAYRVKMQEKLREWTEEMGRNNLEEVIEQGYKQLVRIIKEVATKTIGRRKKRTENRKDEQKVNKGSGK